MGDIEVITKSRLAAYATCQRLHDLTYNQGYRPLQQNVKAAFGSFVHAGLDAWWLSFAAGGEELLALPNATVAMAKYRAEHPSEIDDFDDARGSILMAAYDARWAPTMGEWEVLGSEVQFVAMVPGRKRLRVAGKLDKLLRRRATRRIWFAEHKTSGSDLSAGSVYWQRLRMDPQVSIYFDGCRALGHEDVEGCLYDVVERPDQRPLKATPVDQRQYTIAKPATKTKPAEPSRLYAKQREYDESVAEFRERLGAVVGAAPDSFFGRADVVRLDSEMEASRADVEELAIQIRTGSNTGVAPRNPGACFQYGRACDYFDVCSNTASVDDTTRFKRVENVHQELDLGAAKG